MNLPYLGEICSLLAAILWALAVVLFKKSGEHVHPVALNVFKNVVAALLYLPTLYLTGGTLAEPLASSDYWLLAVSGAIGIALGDTLLFQCLNMIGAGATALVSMLYSPLIISLGFVWLGESLTVLQLAGVALIVGAVFETTRSGNRRLVDRRRRILGIAIGVCGYIAMAVGVVMVKRVLDRSPLIWAIEIRLLGGVAALLLYLLFNPNRGRILSTLLVRESRLSTVTSAIVGGYMAMIVWVAGIKYTLVSIASALNQTNTFFILLFAAWILHERVTRARVIAILVAFAGATLVTFG